MKKITSKKLLNYGAMSAAILGVANVSGQIVYTDIDDVTINELGTTTSVDLDQNGDIDFSLDLPNFTGGFGFVGFPGTDQGGGMGSTDNVFVGFANGNFFYGSNLAEGDIIDATSPTTDPLRRADNNFYGCAYSSSQFCGDLTDAYVGLVFQLNGNTHYGWARIDVNVPDANSGTLTLKDYAYNSVANAPILAGETLSLEDNTIEGFSSFVSDNVLTLNARTPLETITIHSITGQEVITQKLSNTTATIDLNGLSTGVYIATVSVEGKLQAIKFVK